MSKKILSLLLAVVMVVLAIPAVVLPAFAATEVESGGAASSTFTATDDIVAYKDGYTTTGQTFEYAQANWEIGGLSVTDPKAGYYTANYFHATTGAVAADKNSAANFAYSSKGAGFYLTGWQGPGMLCFSADYAGSGNDRTLNGLLNNVTARYTAPYTGSVTIDVSKLVFKNTWSALFCILVNGEPVGQFDTDAFDYATGAGWLDPTATDSTALVEDITVSVNEGDVIDFVVRGSGADASNIATVQPGESFVYSGAKYGLSDWGFGVTYNTSIKSTFNVEENFILNGVDTWATTVPTAADITNSGVWQAGLYGVTLDTTAIAVEGATLDDYLTIDNNFMAFNKIGSANTGEIHVERQDYAGSFQSRALFLQKDSKWNAGWGIFLNTGADYGYTTDGTQPSRPLERYPNTTAVRYTAQKDGTVTITLDGGWYSTWAGEYQHLLVRHNGELVDDITNAGTDVLKTYTRNVNAGDTIEFISVIDPILSKEYSVYNTAAAAKWATLTNILAVRRGFRIDNIDVAYNAAYVDSVETDTFNVLNNFVVSGVENWATTTPTVADITNSGAWQAGLYGVTLDTTAIAVEGATLDDYLTIDNSFLAFNKFNTSVTSTSEIFMERQDYAGSYQSRALYLQKDSKWTGGWGIFLSTGADYGYTTDGTQPSRPLERYPNTTAVRYTAQKDGTVTITLDGGWYSTWAGEYQHLLVRHNGELVDDITNAGTDVLKTYTRNVNAGDTIEFISVIDPILSKEYSVYNTAAAAKWATLTNILAVRRGFRIDNIDVAYTTQASVDVDTTASLTIAEDYALNAYGKVTDATAFSAVVGDQTIAGVAQDNGSFKMVLKDGINLTDLPAAEVDYYLVAEVNGHKITSAPAALNGEALLTAYANGTDEKVANLAKDIHYLAIAANYVNSDLTGTALTTEQEEWVNRNLASLDAASQDVTYTGEEGAYKIVAANANLGDRLSLVLLVDGTNIAALKDNGYKLYAYTEGNTYTAEATGFAGVTANGVDYMGVIVDLPVAAYGETFNFVLQDADGKAVSSTLTYGINTWAARINGSAELDASYKSVARAVYNLGISAAAYKASL